MIHRRDWLKSMGALAVAPFLSPRFKPATAQSTQAPNVLFIAVDDLSAWAIDTYPELVALAPNLNRLAQRGIYFDHAYSPGTTCNPSRTAILTGLPPFMTGIYVSKIDFKKSPVLQEHLTLPEYFREHGYRTLGAGKVFHTPYHAAWDEEFELIYPQDYPKGIDRAARGPLKNGLNLGGNDDWAGLELGDAEFTDWKVAQWARSKLQEAHSQPFFMGVGFFRPHAPWYIPQHYLEQLPKNFLPTIKEGDLADVPTNAYLEAKHLAYQTIVENNKLTEGVAHYLGAIAFFDAMLGLVLDALDESAYRDNTIIALWSDHGIMTGQKEYWDKHVLWDEVIRVPLIIAGQGIQAGDVCSRVVSTLDLYKTLAALCHLPSPEGIHGTSLVPLLSDPHAEWEVPVLITRKYKDYSVRTTQWHYSRYMTESTQDELYNPNTDPNEWTNLATDDRYRDTLAMLAGLLPVESVKSIPSEVDEDDPENSD